MEYSSSIENLSEGESSCTKGNVASLSSSLPAFVCHHCGYRTDGKIFLRTHMVEEHPEVLYHIDLSEDESVCTESNSASSSSSVPVFVCHHCGYRTDGRRALRTHIFDKHPEVGQDSSHFIDTLESEAVLEGSSLPSTSFGLARYDVKEIGDAVPKSLANAKLGRKRNYSNKSSSFYDLKPSKKTKWSKERSYSCNHCEYKSAFSSHLKRHKRSQHTDERPFTCSLCDFTTAHSHSLKKHMVSIHTQERPFACPHCEYKSAYSSNLKEHVMSKHTDKKPFTCPLCDFRSALSGSLKKHVMSKHTDIRPFNCPHCVYKSARSGILKKHIKAKHSDERPFTCPLCEFTSAHSYSLEKHVMSKHTDIRPFTCPHCEYKSAYSTHLKNHIKTKHTKS